MRLDTFSCHLNVAIGEVVKRLKIFLGSLPLHLEVLTFSELQLNYSTVKSQLVFTNSV